MGDVWQERTTALLGEDAIKRLRNAAVVVVGLGGVGSYAFEALIRCGIGHITVIDHDIVEAGNINRQLVADINTIGKPKVFVAKAHGLAVNPKAEISAKSVYLTKENAGSLIPEHTDVILDAIDHIEAKTDLIVYAEKKGIPIISAMGTANKTDPLAYAFGDIYNTSVDPLARVMRRRLKDLGVKALPVIYSKETPKQTPNGELGSVSFVPSVCGLMMAAKAVGYLLNGEWS